MILKKLEFNEGTFPLDALLDVIDNRSRIIPELLKILKQAKEKARDLIEQKIYLAHIYAMFLLAQFREKRAYPLIVDFFSLPGEIPLLLTGGVSPGYLARILASVSCGDENLMKDLIENENINDSVRIAALRGLAALVACGAKSRQEIMNYYQTLFRGKLTREMSPVWNGLVEVSTDLYPEELYEDIKLAYVENLFESALFNLEDIQGSIALGKEKALALFKNYHKYTLIDDTILEMQWWACFDPN